MVPALAALHLPAAARVGATGIGRGRIPASRAVPARLATDAAVTHVRNSICGSPSRSRGLQEGLAAKAMVAITAAVLAVVRTARRVAAAVTPPVVADILAEVAAAAVEATTKPEVLTMLVK
jgi:hypothetical protein